jgi:hypothetical protein
MASSDPRCDAFTTWAFETGFRDGMPAGSQPKPVEAVWLMLRLRDRSGQPAIAWLLAQAKSLPPGWLRIPRQYSLRIKGLDRAHYCTALASPRFIQYLKDPGLVPARGPVGRVLKAIREGIERYEIGLQAAGWNDVGQALPASTPALQPLPPAVIGVIDDGLPFAHERFSWIDGKGARHTRFLSLWDQSAPDASDPRWCLGRVISGAQMDAAMQQASTAHGVDEDAAYHHAGVAHLLRHRITHGAHVADLACGEPPPSSPSAAPAIVGVQLRPMESTLCISPAAHLFDAIRFVIAQADAACGGPTRPIFVNASVGNIAGPKDGHSMFEAAVDELITLRKSTAAPVEVVLPEGNSYLSCCHAWSEINADSALALDWHIRPDDGTSSYLEIWLRPKGFSKHPQKKFKLAVMLTLTSPQGLNCKVELTTRSRSSSVEKILRDANGNVIAVLGLHARPANGRHWMGLVTVAPTAPYGPWTHCAPAGSWRVTVETGSTSDALYCNVYSQRDEKSFGHRGRGRQAVIEDGIDRVYDGQGKRILEDGNSYRRRVGTINGLATGKDTRAVGGVMRSTGDCPLVPASYSAVSIPEDLPAQLRRTLALTDDTVVLSGIHAAGTRSGVTVALVGTSTAAPQQTRALARGQLGGGPAQVEDFNGTARILLIPSGDLAKRSKRRLGA